MGFRFTRTAQRSSWTRAIYQIFRKRIQWRKFEVSVMHFQSCKSPCSFFRFFLSIITQTLRFWESVQRMKTLPQSGVKDAVNNIWREFLGPDAPCPVNVDSKSVELARLAVHSTDGPNRWCFDVAASHVYHLMKSDSYSRYLRSDMYKEYLNGSKKKVKSIPNLFGVKR